MKEKPRNFVKKHMDLMTKPSRMRDRKKQAKKENDYGEKELVGKPYRGSKGRVHKSWLDFDEDD